MALSNRIEFTIGRGNRQKIGEKKRNPNRVALNPHQRRRVEETRVKHKLSWGLPCVSLR